MVDTNFCFDKLFTRLMEEFQCLWNPQEPGFSDLTKRNEAYKQLLDKYNSQTEQHTDIITLKLRVGAFHNKLKIGRVAKEVCANCIEQNKDIADLLLPYPCLWDYQDLNYKDEQLKEHCRQQVIIQYRELDKNFDLDQLKMKLVLFNQIRLQCSCWNKNRPTQEKKPPRQAVKAKQTEPRQPYKSKQTEPRQPDQSKQTEPRQPDKSKQTEPRQPDQSKQTEPRQPDKSKQNEPREPDKSKRSEQSTNKCKADSSVIKPKPKKKPKAKKPEQKPNPLNEQWRRLVMRYIHLWDEDLDYTIANVALKAQARGQLWKKYKAVFGVPIDLVELDKRLAKLFKELKGKVISEKQAAKKALHVCEAMLVEYPSLWDPRDPWFGDANGLTDDEIFDAKEKADLEWDELIKTFPCLWDPDDPNYNNLNVTIGVRKYLMDRYREAAIVPVDTGELSRKLEATICYLNMTAKERNRSVEAARPTTLRPRAEVQPHLQSSEDLQDSSDSADLSKQEQNDDYDMDSDKNDNDDHEVKSKLLSVADREFFKQNVNTYITDNNENDNDDNEVKSKLMSVADREFFKQNVNTYITENNENDNDDHEVKSKLMSVTDREFSKRNVNTYITENNENDYDDHKVKSKLFSVTDTEFFKQNVDAYMTKNNENDHEDHDVKSDLMSVTDTEFCKQNVDAYITENNENDNNDHDVKSDIMSVTDTEFVKQNVNAYITENNGKRRVCIDLNSLPLPPCDDDKNNDSDRQNIPVPVTEEELGNKVVFIDERTGVKITMNEVKDFGINEMAEDSVYIMKYRRNGKVPKKVDKKKKSVNSGKVLKQRKVKNKNNKSVVSEDTVDIETLEDVSGPMSESFTSHMNGETLYSVELPRIFV